MALLAKLKRIAFRPFDRGDLSTDGERTVENDDALAATAGRGFDAQGGSHATFLLDYVKQGDGRPLH
jgi:hypothetical protein